MAVGLLAIGVRGQGPGAFITDQVTGVLVARGTRMTSSSA